MDVRIVCATHQDLKQLIAEGRFREDLYYRISEITIEIPSVKEREGDAVVLAKAFLNRFSEEYGRQVRGFDPQALAAIEAYDWPGNVREIESRIKRAVIMSDGPNITLEDLELDIAPEDTAAEMPLNLQQVRERAEQQAIIRALHYTDFNISESAKLLGITRPTLYRLMEKYRISAEP